MSEHGLPILDELRADLAAAFQSHESTRDRRAAVPNDDQFAFVHSEGSNLATYAGVNPAHRNAVTLQSFDRRSWMSIDRPGRIEQRVLGSKPLTPADARRAQDPDANVGVSEPIGAIHDYHLGGDRLSRTELLAYPTDPRTIYDQLLAGVGDAGHSPHEEVFVTITDALRELPAPAALRAGLYRALALVPGVRFLGAVHDSAGRPGTAIALTSVGVRHELIIDARTSELLATQDVLVDPQRRHRRPALHDRRRRGPPRALGHRRAAWTMTTRRSRRPWGR